MSDDLKTCECGNKDCLGFLLLHEKELITIEQTKDAMREKHGDVNFELKLSPSSGEIFTKFYELHIIKIVVDNPKYIKNWEELNEVESLTHTLEIDLNYGCGWINPKDAIADKWHGRHYLSTHTFYGLNHEHSTKLLQSCGFNVVLANWDESKC